MNKVQKVPSEKQNPTDFISVLIFLVTCILVGVITFIIIPTMIKSYMQNA